MTEETRGVREYVGFIWFDDDEEDRVDFQVEANSLDEAVTRAIRTYGQGREDHARVSVWNEDDAPRPR